VWRRLLSCCCGTPCRIRWLGLSCSQRSPKPDPQHRTSAKRSQRQGPDQFPGRGPVTCRPPIDLGGPCKPKFLENAGEGFSYQPPPQIRHDGGRTRGRSPERGLYVGSSQTVHIRQPESPHLREIANFMSHLGRRTCKTPHTMVRGVPQITGACIQHLHSLIGPRPAGAGRIYTNEERDRRTHRGTTSADSRWT